MVSSGKYGIMCGGYGPNSTGTMLAGPGGSMDCWILALIPLRWTRLGWLAAAGAGAGGPSPRSAHAMVYDGVSGRVVVFGGLDAAGGALGDCWHANASAPAGAGAWTQCAAAAVAGGVAPAGRFGHGAAHFRDTLYVLGGYGGDGAGGTVALGDMWALAAYAAAGGDGWAEVVSTTRGPTARALFACWLSGYRLFVHGGQVPPAPHRPAALRPGTGRRGGLRAPRVVSLPQRAGRRRSASYAAVRPSVRVCVRARV